MSAMMFTGHHDQGTKKATQVHVAPLGAEYLLYLSLAPFEGRKPRFASVRRRTDDVVLTTKYTFIIQ